MRTARRDGNGLRLDLSICAWCKRYVDWEAEQIVDPPGDIQEGDQFSHTICSDCAVILKAELDETLRLIEKGREIRSRLGAFLTSQK